MQLGLTWPLQRLLKAAVPYGAPVHRGFCWDAHCITLRGRSSLLLVHCYSRYTCVRCDMSAREWDRLAEIAREEIRLGLLEAGIQDEAVTAYMQEAGNVQLTRTHGRREVAFLNRAWEDAMAADLLADPDNAHQPMLNRAVNSRPCRCAGTETIDTAQAHLIRYFRERGD